MTILMIFIALIVGIVLSWLYCQMKFQKKIQSISEAKKEADFKVQLLENEKVNIINGLNEKINYIENEKNNIKTELVQLNSKNEELTQQLAKKETQLDNLNEKLISQKQELEEIQKKFTTEFENIANKILKQNSQEFTISNQKNISEILNPLKEKIQTFEQKVAETHEKEMRDNISLREEVKKLYELNYKISEEANNLTKALKGDTKLQGSWGELVLERILERSGLIENEEYEKQVSFRNDNNELIRPDIIIKLPDNKHIIIDSKVSLVAYERYINADNNEEKEKYSRLHIESIKNHVKLLNEKNYSGASLLNTPDFVLMFLPIEASFSVAIQKDIELFNYAWDKRIVIVSPSTLLATLKTIASIWKNEKQTQNALEIANEGGKLIDKIISLMEDMKKIGNQLETVQKTYNEANIKLYTGKGNIVSRVKNMQRLGAKNTKNIPDIYLKSINTSTEENNDNEQQNIED